MVFKATCAPAWAFPTPGSKSPVLIDPSLRAKRSNPKPGNQAMDCFVAEFIIEPAEGGTRWLLAMTKTKRHLRGIADEAFVEIRHHCLRRYRLHRQPCRRIPRA